MSQRRRTRPAAPGVGPFRSMNWLRRAGALHRLRAALLLVSFALGSLLARDALLVQQVITLRAEATLGAVESDELATLPAFEEPAAKHKVRPSGLSRRCAMNPWDPPDDDDELDQDSDTIAASYATLAILPAVLTALGESFGAPCSTPPVAVAVRPRFVCHRTVSSRGPPA